ncbi:uncharacterized protein Z518_08858 [Rhinocladiella mackenziei CBS 650.93]|uniref:Uncharacterized protein n=1 Tax=Rhinocladiella mackenziei CBS 650.93 TaxID=1442369 RepID=A0A0D2J1Z2_9EURO|nr:uncharacterized protein Z518_08858 [Rhinocladiella mackenziei CBS 650.93]KIX02915.1 hypothetical protein Z518_08858 [Rhinocladiella mackenziei CBS 650.93]
MMNSNACPSHRHIQSTIPITNASPTSTYSPVFVPEMRYLAYKLGYLSKSNIQREVRKAEPRLYKLIGHAALFDNAKKFITEHTEHDVREVEGAESLAQDYDDEDEDGPSFGYVEDLRDEESTESSFPPLDSSNYSTQQNGKNQPVLSVSATEIELPATEGDGWENDSDSSTEAGDDGNQSDGDWSDSTCEEYEDEDDENVPPDRKIVDIFPEMTYDFTTASKYSPQDDDLVLWSQQPRVLSQSQADSLLVEAFG